MRSATSYIHSAGVLTFGVLGFFLTSCSTTKFVPQGDYLLWKEDLKVEGKGLKKNDFQPLIRQQPNRTIFKVFRFNLWFYNLSSDKDRRWDRWMRSVGEPPVVFDSVLTVDAAERMQRYANHRGYYGSEVAEKVTYKKRNAAVSYEVKLAQPYRISSISYDVMDKSLDTSFIVDAEKRLIKVGSIFDSEALMAESERVVAEMRKRGYYKFSDSFVSYQADTTAGERGVRLTLLVRQEPAGAGNALRNHRLFYVDRLLVNPEYSSESALLNTAYGATWDTIRGRGFDLLCRDCGQAEKPYLRPDLLAISNRIRLGELYSVEEVNRTYANLANLRLFKSINILFSELPPDSLRADDAPRPLAGSIILAPFKRQSYTLGGEVSYSGAGLYGAAFTGSYQHKNLFRGAEIFGVSLTGAFQKVQVYADSAPNDSYELGATVSLSIPKFLVPLTSSFYRNVFSPRTQIVLSGDFQQRPDYTRTMGSFSYGYSWRNLGQMTYIYNPVDMNLIYAQITDKFRQSIESNPYMLNSYQNTFLLGSAFSARYNSRAANKLRQYNLRGDLELKGNLLWLGYQLAGATPSVDLKTGAKTYEVWGTQFAQFAKFDLTYTSLRNLNANNAVAMRALGGVGVAYGNYNSLPFDKMYYAGGANGLRGWQVRTVGPGSYSVDTVMLNRLSDMRLEFNLEYRFNLFWKLEGALFFDAGNIWAIKEKDNREGARADSFEQFVEQVAMDWGMGLRLNFTVMVIRLDYGIQLHNPTTNDYFIRPPQWFKTGNNSLFIALGYPF